MAPVVVRHRVLDLAQNPAAGVPVVARLVATSSWLTSEKAETRGADDQVTGADGRVQLTLTPQNELAVDETHYAITVGGSVTYYCVVPDTGPVDLYDILVDPTTLDPSSPSTPSTYQVRAERGAANGYATLGADGKVPASQLPPSSGGELDADLVAIGALNPTNDDVIQRKGGAWTNRTPAQLKTDQAFVKADVGLGNVDNTSDAGKPVSTAQAAAIANRGVQATASSGIAHTVFTGDTNGAWTLCPAAYRVTIAAAIGDVLHWEPHLLVAVGGDAELDVASVVSGAAARYFSSGTTVQGANGHGGLYIGTGYNRALKPIRWIVTADDLDSGNVTLALMYRSGAGVTFGNAFYPGQVDLTNLGGVPA